VNLAEHISSGLLDFMDVLSYVRPPEPSDKASPTLRPLFDQISSTIEPSSTPTLIILDDVTSLEWIGFSFLDIARFTRALRALCLKVRSHDTFSVLSVVDILRGIRSMQRWSFVIIMLRRTSQMTYSGICSNFAHTTWTCVLLPVDVVGLSAGRYVLTSCLG
jgi:hypothetical protein